MNIRAYLTAVALGSTLVFAGCQGTGINNQAIGAASGALVGGVVGNQFGKGSGRTAATIAGALAGGIIGSSLGARLDEQDRQRAYNAEYQALEYGASGRPVEWRSPDSGYYGEVVPLQTYQVGGSNCRQYTHTIYIDGTPQTARGTACREADGTWRPVS